MLAAIKHGVANLANVQGRDARQAFWFYVLFVYLITMMMGMMVSVPMSMQAMMIGVQQGMTEAANADRAAGQAAVQAAIAGSMGGYMPVLFWITFASAAILLVGLAASVVRRLHDANLPGWLALIPGGLQAISLFYLPGQFEKMKTAMAGSMAGDPAASLTMMQGSLNAGTVAGWVAIVAVIVIGTRKSTEGPNRYGAAPFVA